MSSTKSPKVTAAGIALLYSFVFFNCMLLSGKMAGGSTSTVKRQSYKALIDKIRLVIYPNHYVAARYHNNVTFNLLQLKL